MKLKEIKPIILKEDILSSQKAKRLKNANELYKQHKALFDRLKNDE